jgi:O-acetyl-ADP-ribose deacetylase (regulator of RNase III)
MNTALERVANYKFNNTIFRAAYGDITQLTTDAPVSSDDGNLSMGGGVYFALLTAGGSEIRTQANKHKPLNLGDVAVTCAGQLIAKYIFHAVTVDYNRIVRASEESIHAITLKCMRIADTLEVHTIAFPALGTGVAGFPFQLAAEVMTRTITDYLTTYETCIELVILILHSIRSALANKSDINLFFERAAALASISSQSQKLNAIVEELEGIVRQMNTPSLLERVVDLQTALAHAKDILAERPTDLNQLEQIQHQSDIGSIVREAVTLSSKARGSVAWTSKELEAKVLQTNLNGLLTEMNVKVSNRNRLQIERAKSAGILIPPRLEIAIEEVDKEVAQTEKQIREVRVQLSRL